MGTNTSATLAAIALMGCSPSQIILDYDETGSTDDSAASIDDSTDDGELLDLGDPDPDPEEWECERRGLFLSQPVTTEFVGPVHRDDNLYWGAWGQAEGDLDGTRSWQRLELVPEIYAELHVSGGGPGHSLAVDDQYLYASSHDHSPIRIALDGGIWESLPSPPGYSERSTELLLLEDHLFWLNHSGDEVTLIQTKLEPVSSAVVLNEALGGQLAGNEETGVIVLRPDAKSTAIVQVDPISGDSVELTSLPVDSESIAELLTVDDLVYVAYDSGGTAQIDRIALDGATTAIVAPGTYTLITHPVTLGGRLYFEFADPEFAWGHVDLDGGPVVALGPEPGWNPQRWQPMSASDDCLFVRVTYPDLPNSNSLFEIVSIPG